MSAHEQLDQRLVEEGNVPPEPPQQHYNLFLAPITDDKGSLDDLCFEYDIFKRLDFNFPLTLFLTILLTVVFVTRGSFATLWWLKPAAPFYLAFFLGGMSAVTGFISTFSRFAIRSYVYGITPLQKFHDWAVNVSASHRGHIAENANILCFTATVGLYTLGRSMVGRCPEGASLWDKQSCNPSADTFTPPVDFYPITMFATLLSQLLFKGAKRWAIVLSWVLCVALFNASHVVVGAALDTFFMANLQLVLLIGLSYEYERGLLSTFLASKERDRVDDKRIEAVEQLETNKRTMMEAELEKKRALVRHIGHEIRNPLNTIQGLLEVLQLELKPFSNVLTADIMEIISTCKESCNLGREIVSDLVAFERIAAGNYTLELSHVSILNYMYETIRPSIIAARAKRVNVALQKMNCVETTMVNIDQVKMGQVMRNLMSNAVKFSRRGGEVVVTVTEEAATVTVAVTDQGPGMTPLQIDCLFQEGVQFESNKHQNGYVVIAIDRGLN